MNEPEQQDIQQCIKWIESGELQQAQDRLQAILELEHNNDLACHLLAFIAYNQQQIAEAEQYWLQAITLAPENADYHNNLAHLYDQLQQVEKSIKHFELAHQYMPDSLNYRNNLASAYLHNKQYELAETMLLSVLDVEPTHELALYNIGTLYCYLNKVELAKKYLLKLTADNPKHVQALYILSRIEQVNGNIQKAIDYGKLGLTHAPQMQLFHKEIAYNYSLLGDNNEAVRWLEQALTIDATDTDTLYSIANSLYRLDKNVYAENYCEQALQQKPDSLQILSLLLLIKKNNLSWHNLSELEQKFNQLLSADHPTNGTNHILLEAINVAPKLILKVMQNYSAYTEQYATPCKAQHVRVEERQQLNIGYISADFNDHPIGLLINDSFKYHSNATNIRLYDLAETKDAVHQQIYDSVNGQVYYLKSLSNQDAYQVMQDHRLDVLVDLSGITSLGRPSLNAMRPAAKQCYFLGSTITTGSTYMDYHITTPDLMTEAGRQAFSEKMIFLKDTIIAIDSLPRADNLPTKETFGLPENKFIFACLSAKYRITADLFDAWAEILLACPDALLWLPTNESHIAQNIAVLAKQRNINASQILTNPTGILSHTWPMRFIDLVLDTPIMHSFTSSILCYDCNTPVLSVEGITQAQRKATMFSKQLDAEYFNAKSTQEYIDKAIAYYQDRQLQHDLLNKIKQAKQHNSALYAPQSFILQLEQAYSKIMQNMAAGVNSDIYL